MVLQALHPEALFCDVFVNNPPHPGLNGLTRSAMCFRGRIRWEPAGRIESHCCLVVSSDFTSSLRHGNAPDQYPLLAQLSLCVMLGAHFEEKVHELLQWLGLAGHDKADNVHEQAGLWVAIKHYGEHPLLCRLSDGGFEGGAAAIAGAHHGLDLLLIAALLERLLELILGRNVGGIVLVYLSPSVSSAELPTARWSVPGYMNSPGRSPF